MYNLALGDGQCSEHLCQHQLVCLLITRFQMPPQFSCILDAFIWKTVKGEKWTFCTFAISKSKLTIEFACLLIGQFKNLNVLFSPIHFISNLPWLPIKLLMLANIGFVFFQNEFIQVFLYFNEQVVVQ